LTLSATERSKVSGVRDRSLLGVSAPWLDFVRPKKGNGAALIAIPGGGYHHMAWDKEGLDIAAWFAERGIAGFALAYRLPLDGWGGGLDTPLADAQRAVRIVRGRAAEFGIDPARIAVVGFSAGGHLVANLAAQFDRAVYPQQDDLDRISARPDLAVPLYPLVMADRIAAAAPAGRPPFGKEMSPEALVRHSPHLQARADAPPHFLVHAEDDPLLPPEHSLALRAALRAKAVRVETHLFAAGGHGFGIRNTIGLPVANWPERLLAFGRSTGWTE
jgi:acetyl esterase/lipase